ncbi:MAG: ABC transporter permease [Campylobacterales bacterium]|nr:ABC transporter permease [Campylobacterales bacterium]
MSIVSFLVKRFLRFDKEQPFIFLSALLAFLGITLGVMVLMIAMALMNGFDNEFKKKLTVMNYPLTILPRFYGSVNESLLLDLEAALPELHFSPYVSSPVMARSGSRLEGGYLFGVEFESERKVNAVIDKALQSHLVDDFEVLVGKSLQQEFGIASSDKLTYVFTQMEPGGLGVTPRIKRFEVVGIFDSGLSAYDKAYAYTTLASLQKILRLPSNLYDGIHIFSYDPQTDIHRIKAMLPQSVGIKGWWEDNVNFFAALELEKTALFIVLMLIILIASINIISSLLMTVMNRRSEIALLISLGASSAQIKKVFMYLGIVIGLAGIVAGTLLGFFGLWVLGTFEIVSLPKDVYPTSTLPLDLSLIDLSMILIGAFVIVLLSSFYPAKKASEVDVLTVLRNE